MSQNHERCAYGYSKIKIVLYVSEGAPKSRNKPFSLPSKPTLLERVNVGRRRRLPLLRLEGHPHRPHGRGGRIEVEDPQLEVHRVAAGEAHAAGVGALSVIAIKRC